MVAFFHNYGLWILLGLIFFIIIMNFGVRMIFQNSTKKYFSYQAFNGLTGSQVAKKLLEHYNVKNVHVIIGANLLGDNFNPYTKTINLSREVYNSKTISAQAIACHEAGHAVQFARNYWFAHVRTFLAKPLQGITMFIWPLFFLSIFIRSFAFIFVFVFIGILFFTFLFRMATLPVEFNASHIAKKFIKESDIDFTQAEYKGVKRVLFNAVMTYLAAAFGSLLFIIYIILASMR